MSDYSGFMAINDEMERQRARSESAKGVDTPFRVEFRYQGKSRKYCYFATLHDAINAESPKRCTYSPFGNAILEGPSSCQIQVRGVRGGWSKYRKPTPEQIHAALMAQGVEAVK